MTARARTQDRLVGELVAGRYRVERKIGKGGMGNVYEVSHTKLDRRFALKTLADDLADDPESLARFRREADVISRLKHPNIVEIVDWEELDGTPCIVMELLSGQVLSDRLRTGPLEWTEIAHIGDEILSALSMAHAAGVVHRDLKPQNIYLAEDGAGGVRAKLLDFGVSKISDSKTFATTDAKMLGTPAYMAPEQADGRQELVGPKTDVWAMGAILYEMATGTTAFAGPSVPAILYRVCHGAPEPLLEQRSDAPQAFVDLVARALSHGEDRIEDVDRLRVGLRRALRAFVPEHGFTSSLSIPQMELLQEVSSVAAAAATIAERRDPEPRASKRRPLLWAAIVGLLVAGGGVANLLSSTDHAGASAPATSRAPTAAPDAPAPSRTSTPGAPATALDSSTSPPAQTVIPEDPKETATAPATKGSEPSSAFDAGPTAERANAKPPEQTNAKPPERANAKPPERANAKPPQQANARQPKRADIKPPERADTKTPTTKPVTPKHIRKPGRGEPENPYK